MSERIETPFASGEQAEQGHDISQPTLHKFGRRINQLYAPAYLSPEEIREEQARKERIRKIGRRLGSQAWSSQYLEQAQRFEEQAAKDRLEQDRQKIAVARRKEAAPSKRPDQRAREIAKEHRPTVDMGDEAQANAFYAQVENEGLPQQQEIEPDAQPELIRSLEKELNSHFDSYVQESAKETYHSGYSVVDYAKMLGRRLDESIENSDADESDRYSASEKLSVEIIPNALEGKQEHIRSAERSALISLVEEGAKVVTDEYGNKQVEFALPSELLTSQDSEGAKKFYARFGSERASKKTFEQVLGSREVFSDDPDVRRSAYRGFANIAETLRVTETPDTSYLDRYFDHFRFAEDDNMTGFISSIMTSKHVSEATRNYIDRYLSTRPEMESYYRSANSMRAAEKKELAELSSDFHYVTSAEAAQEIGERYGIDREALETLNYEKIQEAIFTEMPIERQPRNNGRTIGIETDAVVPISATEPSFDAQAYSNRESRRRPQTQSESKETRYSRRQSSEYAKYKAAGMKMLHQMICENVDSTATIVMAKSDAKDGEPANVALGDSSYLILLFNKEIDVTDENGEASKKVIQFAIAESTAINRATYTYCGEPGTWIDAFSKPKQTARHMPGVKRQVHRSFTESIKTHHKKTLTDLGLDWREIIKDNNPKSAQEDTAEIKQQSA